MKKKAQHIELLLILLLIVIDCCFHSTKGAPLKDQNISRRDTSRIELLLLKGRKEYYSKFYYAAIADFDEVIKDEPNNWTAYHFKADAEASLELYDSAIKNYSRGIKINKTDTLAFRGRAEVYRMKSDYKRAIEDYNVIIEWRPYDPIMLYGRGDCLYQLSRYQYAIEDLTSAIKFWKTVPQIKEAYLMRGHCYYSMGEFIKSVSDFTRYYDLGGKNLKFYYRKGLAYLQLIALPDKHHYADSAITNLNRFIVSFPEESKDI